jgi:hypothetical protein
MERNSHEEDALFHTDKGHEGSAGKGLSLTYQTSIKRLIVLLRYCIIHSQEQQSNSCYITISFYAFSIFSSASHRSS